jgi:hypothetical protein
MVRPKTSHATTASRYSTPDDAVAELKYLGLRGYPVSYVEMGEEPDRHYTVMKVRREDGVPKEVPLLITESNLCSKVAMPVE